MGKYYVLILQNKKYLFIIILNLKGENWGESGYMRIARNRNNLCGLATDVSYPIVK
jgi:hypothetical protein